MLDAPPLPHIIPPDFNFREPDYAPVIAARIRRLERLRRDRGLLADTRAYYALNIPQFITDWGMTLDPRNVERSLPSAIPFILFQRQVEWIEYTLRKWRAQEPGLTEKSRDMGATWLAVAFACSMCLFHEGFSVGFGSRKEEYVDKLGDPKSIFYKARYFLQRLPPLFRPGYDPKRNAPHMRIEFPATRSIITGEAGDGIGRGDRQSIYFVDEAAYLERAELVEASLSNTTNARHDISSVHGMANVFAQKRFGGAIEPFIFDYREDPRKNEEWAAKKLRELGEIIFNQEIGRDYNASVEGILIPQAWVQAAVDAHIVLNIPCTGKKRGALDVADEGIDKNAFAAADGWLLTHLEEWRGKNSDIFETAQRTFRLCDTHGLEDFDYDSDGLGVGIRGDARILNEKRAETKRRPITAHAFRGSGAVLHPNRKVVGDRANEDFFGNFKIQAGWALKLRFYETYKAVVLKEAYDADNLISIPRTLPLFGRLLTELSQPTIVEKTTGKIYLDKKPDGTASPNLFDAVMILFAPRKKPLVITKEHLRQAKGANATRRAATQRAGSMRGGPYNRR